MNSCEALIKVQLTQSGRFYTFGIALYRDLSATLTFVRPEKVRLEPREVDGSFILSVGSRFKIVEIERDQ